MKILRFQSENIKRIFFVEIIPEGNLVVISGKNSAGKSSCLDAIEYVLRGVAGLPSKPLRKGAEDGYAEIDLGDLVAKRTFNLAGNTHLVVKNKDGVRQQRPQEILDNLVGKLSFDPLAFIKQPPAKQSETLRLLLGLDFSAQEQEKAKLYDERTAVNRELKTMEANLTTLPPEVSGAPKDEVSTADVLAEQTKAAGTNAANAAARALALRLQDAYERTVEALAEAQGGVKATEDEITALQAILASQRKMVEEREHTMKSAKKVADESKSEADKRQDIKLDGFRAKIAEVEKTNFAVRANKRRGELRASIREKSKSADALTRKIDAIDVFKRQAIKSAKFPVPGLGIGETGEVTFNDLPFNQAGTAEQLRASVAIGIAMNPKLRVLLIRAGNDLDSDGLKLVADMAKEAEAQIWLEKISSDGLPCVLLEDGHVAGQEAPPAEDPSDTAAPSDSAEQQEMGITP